MPDRATLTGILFVLRTGIQWEMLPLAMRCGSGITCWRRLRNWQETGAHGQRVAGCQKGGDNDHRRCRQACRRRGIAPHIAGRGIEISQKLGRHRWVIERTFAWINRFRRLVTRYERRSDIHYAFTALACFSKLQARF